MSLSWSRIIPKGGSNDEVNEEGVAFYRKVIQALLDAEIVSLNYSSSRCDIDPQTPFVVGPPVTKARSLRKALIPTDSLPLGFAANAPRSLQRLSVP